MAIRRKIQKTTSNQYILTIPKAFAETLDFSRGTILEFKLEPSLSLRLIQVDIANKATRMRIQTTPNNQSIITIPKALAETLEFNQGTQVEVKIAPDMSLTITKL